MSCTGSALTPSTMASKRTNTYPVSQSKKCRHLPQQQTVRSIASQVTETSATAAFVQTAEDILGFVNKTDAARVKAAQEPLRDELADFNVEKAEVILLQ